MQLNERIHKIREEFCGGNNSEFASILEFKPQYASNICKNRKNIGDKTLDKILEKFPDINPVWLKMGEGEMLKENIDSLVSEPHVKYENGDLRKLVIALENISESVKLNAIANERNSRTMEKMVDFITGQQGCINKQTGT